MEPSEYEIMYQVEEHHWWYQGMASISCALLDRFYSATSNLQILDAGCGTGAAITSYLKKYGKPTGIDLYQLAVNFSQKKGASRLARASVLNLPFAAASFDLVTSFDVLYEHGVPNENEAIREFVRTLKPGGRVLLRLPAFNWLRGRHDDQVHTRQRYTSKQVFQILRNGGLRVENITYANMFLFPIAVIKRLMEKILPSPEKPSDLSITAGPLNNWLQEVLSTEAKIISKISLPFGLSVFAVGIKD